jgi:hypothetical protein
VVVLVASVQDRTVAKPVLGDLPGSPPGVFAHLAPLGLGGRQTIPTGRLRPRLAAAHLPADPVLIFLPPGADPLDDLQDPPVGR